MTQNKLKKIALGSAQFGLDYGISNVSGQVPCDQISAILEMAVKHGVTTLDTAAAYGNAEIALGKAGVAAFDIVTKLAGASIDCLDHVDRELENSLKRLKVDSIYGYLVHDPRLLLSAQGDDVYARLRALRSQGLVRKIGVSTYTPEETRVLCARYDIDLVQIPLSPIDTRWNQTLEDLDAVEVHCRSIFLQGLLLMSPDMLTQNMALHAPIIRAWRDWCADHEMTALEACLRFAQNHPRIDKAIVGVTNMAEFMQILTARPHKEFPALLPSLGCDNPEILDPSRWPSE